MAKAQAKGVRVQLSGNLTVRTIGTACSEMRDALARDMPVEIDCSGATEIDLSLIQLLLAARRSAGDRLHLVQPLPDALRDGLRRGGFLTPGSGDLSLWQKQSDAA